jgi:single-stranded-DNA-specific exonuclease
LLRAKTRWKCADCHPEDIERLVHSLHIDPIIARLLVVRGLTEPDQARRFLFGAREDFHDPFLLDGMDVAVERIHRAIRNGERIRIYGDYDADGVSSTSLMTHLMRQLEANFDYYIPNRFTEGYGLHIPALQKAKDEGVKLLITVDTGISAVEQVEFANGIGLDVIITDHHEPPEVIPDAFAIINPKKPACSYPFDMLAGVGVAFKLAHALLGRLPEEWLEIAAIGTIADLVPLVDENRLLVKYGLEQMNRTRLPGMKSLVSLLGASDKVVGVGHVGFGIAPRINAGGRLDSADEAVKLLTTVDDLEAEHLSRTLDSLNKERQRLVEEMTQEAFAMWEEMRIPSEEHFIVLAKEGWNAGVIGIVASKLVEKYYRPVIILSIDREKGLAKGSARSIEALDLYQALTHCKDLLPHYGGHKMAAGMTLPVEQIDELRKRLNSLAKEWLSEEDYIPLTKVDMECKLDPIDLPLLQEMQRLAPFGIGNPTPRWLVRGVTLGEIRTLGKNQNHLKMQLIGNKKMDAIGFHMADTADHLTVGSNPRLVGEFQINEWNDILRPQFMIKDIEVPHVQVFDWRTNASNPVDRLERWNTLLEGESIKEQAALVLFNKATWDERLDENIKRAFKDNVGLVNRVGGFEALQQQDGAHCDFSNIKYVLFVDIPERMNQWNTALKPFPNIERVYCCFPQPDRAVSIPVIPERDHFGKVYRWLNAMDRFPTHTDLGKISHKVGLSVTMIEFMIHVFKELGFVVEEGNTLRVVPSPVKRDLDESALYQRTKETDEVEKTLVNSSTKQLSEYILKQIELNG